ncbi:YpmS family protein [Lactobacillus alvi]|uniref:YpmS family protein n=1 Tax=Limosilactobacillus alvi TaxID=990412 RepID=A0ABS2EN93_9LACO|nr:YpmS family protein [Limosilactobacillus alvi]MBM6753888.1 YpmS family protein [Limosilactobacillus alvi]
MNKWKVAFFTLLALIVVSFGSLYVKATAPTNVSTELKAPTTKAPTLDVTMNRAQVNALSANYLNRFLKNSRIKYRFVVGAKYATVIGTTKVLGAKVQFAMNFVPEKTDAGNILLRAKGLSVGRLNLPLKFVLAYVKKNYDLPKWVSINQKKQTILLDLNRYSQHQSVRYTAQKLNMQAGKFVFRITIPKGDK